MITTFFRRWWMTRQLYRYIFKQGDITPPLGSTTTRANRIRNGANQKEFISWVKWEWENWNDEKFSERVARPDTSWEKFRFNLPWRKNKRESFNEWAEQTINECVDIGYIDRYHLDWIRLGDKGMKVHVWYYPAVAFFDLHYIKVVITKTLEWGIPLVLIYLFTRFFHITITASK